MKPSFPKDQELDFSAVGPVGVLDIMRHTTTPELVRAHYEEAKRLALIQSLKGADSKRWRDEMEWIEKVYKKELRNA